ncbi:anthranilate synthase component I family protein [Natronoflexus pectinivorans]|uniref:Para-aminobenzoate synthetase component 1 n=1 Tax=Natronoflexus pectinivorans TaxID=682526 RepID=A0A4R2GIN7_9BACT|nr:anthranilate synthase component I family protein [Natronoflexus pectinivorans]TCO07763.1 para-aminobenzoate synthetase component 1 [Natronoflexus pectinivorans]
MRKWITFNENNHQLFLKQLIQSTAKVKYATILYDASNISNGCYHALQSESLLAALDVLEEVQKPINELKQTMTKADWYFGFLSYDLKNELFPNLKTNKSSRIEFPDLFFFRPKWMIRYYHEQWQIGYDPEYDSEITALEHIDKIKSQSITNHTQDFRLALQPAISKESYMEHVLKLQEHIQRGNIYEVNYCMEFFAEEIKIDPAQVFFKFTERFPMPFSAFLKYGDKYAISASPERYLTKKGNNLYSMPMKGTAPRGKTPEEDAKILEQLKNSTKERSENIMITDLVRNDLSHVAAKGSVKVEELCNAYAFPNVYQVVSTISAELKNPEEWVAPIIHSFPMGSMTGAPKISAMQLIDQFEPRNRGLFSGSIGYITPEKDFDFNVLIRTLFYDKEKKTASYWAGSAITALANAEDEYNECLLKAGMVLGG